MPGVEATRAMPGDREAVVAITTLAFANDPLWNRAMAIEGGTTEHHARFWRLFVEGALR